MNLQSHLRDDEFGEDRIKQYFEFMVRWKLELMN
jgi:hypothetical protein